jgi:acetyl esterase/lipase
MHRTLVLLPLLSVALTAAEPVTLKLWPGGAPEPAGFQAQPEEVMKRVPDDGIRRVAHVSVPEVTFYPAEGATTTVLVCPGGGYNILAIEHEGTEVCRFLNRHGYHAALLKYRVPRRDPANPGREPLQDAQRALGLLRNRAAELGLQPDRLGILGFSAGGHLAVMTALHQGERSYPQDAKLDAANARPDFCIPVYPAYLVGKDDTFTLLPEVKVTEQSPPMCLIHAHDDKGVTSSSASALLYLEYKKLGLPCELHIYSQGGHGFGMKRKDQPVQDWAARVVEWLKASGW